ncbi:sugar phosphate nucleotidyltransferase [Natrialbaceae archaeon A-CW1-1]
MNPRFAIVLAAGEGRRLRPLTRHRPKPMLPAVTKPILEHVFDVLVDTGITEIVVVVGHGRDRVQSHFGSTYRDVPLTYVVQDKQLGSGHALLTAASEISGSALVVNGDQLVDERIVEDVRTNHDAAAAATIGTTRRDDVSLYGGVILEGDRVVELVERPQDSRHYRLNAGVYAIEPVVLEVLESMDRVAGELSLVDCLSAVIDRGETVRGVASEGLWIDATYPWDLLEVARALFDHGLVESHVDAAARVHDSAVIREPVAISADCVVGPGAVVGPYVSLGANVTVGSGTVVEHSVVDADTRIGSGATVIEGVTGRGVQIGVGSSVVGGSGDVVVGDRIHQRESLGALLADRVSDEGGVTYAPGTMVGAETEIHAGATVNGTLESDAEVWH